MRAARKQTLRFSLAAVAIAALFVAGLTLPVGDYLVRFLAVIEALGIWGLIALVLAYVVACLFLVPGSLLTLGAGFAFGVVRGTIAVWIGATLGATAAFLTGRTLARGWVEQKVAGSERFRALDAAVAEHGFLIVFLTRLSPVIPFNLLNYALGVTKVSLPIYVVASCIGMLPGTIMYVYLGSAAKSLADVAAGRVERSTGHQVLFGAGLVATIVLTVVITRVARRALQRAAPNNVSSHPE